jgi:Flp pilus assembly protein TadD
MEAQLRHYLARGKFEAAELSVGLDLDGPRAFVTRDLTPSEVCYRLGDELLHIGRLEAAESYFARAKTLAPGSPLPYEGLGLLAAWRGKPDEAVGFLRQARQHGPLNFLAHYTCAQEQFLLATGGAKAHRLDAATASEIGAELQNSLALMPDFGPAHYLLGLFEMVHGGDLTAAQRQIASAIQLEPENQSYVLSMAQLQLARRDPAAARRTLEALRLPYVQPEVRAHAEEMLKAIGQTDGHGR